MLIGRDDKSNDVIALGTCFHVFCNIFSHLHSFPLCTDWWKSDSLVNGEPQGNRDVVASSPSFSHLAT